MTDQLDLQGRLVLVTGGAGFIGSHLVDHLVDAGAHVRVIDDLRNGRTENLRNAERTARVELIRKDVSRLAADDAAFSGVSWVFHLAAMADIVPSIEEPTAYLEANVNGTVAALEASRHHGIERFVYVASSSCYGIPDVYPTPETAEIRPMYPYALTKYLGEQCVMHWGKTYGLGVVSLRLFNVFGPRHRTSGAYGAVFGVFIGQKLAGHPFTVVGDGEQTRDFTFVSDVVDALITAGSSGITGEIMNVGSGGTYSVNRLVALLGGDTVHVPKRPGEPESTFADTTKIRRLLGWSPRVSFDDGVRIMLDNIEDWRDAPVWTPEKIEESTAGWFKYLGQTNE